MAIKFPSKKPKQDISLDNSPYTAPRTEITAINTGYDGQYNDSKFYSWNGRIGRIQYIAYPTMFGLVAMLIMMVVFMAMGGMASIASGSVSDSLSGGLVGLFMLLMLGMTYIQFATSKRRLNDLNRTGWLSLLLFVPIASLLLYIYLLAMKGDEGINDYGLPPAPPSRATIIIGIVLPLVGVALIGILAAIAIPAYQDYVERAKEQSSQVDDNSATTAPVAPTDTAPASGVIPASVVLPSVTTVPATEPAQSANDDLTKPVMVDKEANKENGKTAETKPSDAPADAKPTSDKPEKSKGTEVAFAEPNKPANKASGNGNSSSMSYEEFVKASEQPIFADR
ncbi:MULTISPECIES: DUF805 domain-containing protein [unclassified Moraxella]|uniref:DUF805 domain-containing protein n=1 Tax=unclassified Moraxella TaxID=2685852 RepID=UPI003AF68439